MIEGVVNCQSEDVVVAMSGGVDSSVAAWLLQRQGLRVVGVSMQVWDYRENGGSCSRATCCAPSDFADARRVASLIGAPYYVFDFEKTFRSEVIDKFVRSYQEGLTPNPCVDCNNRVKFAELRRRAKSIGIGSVATGHYAKIQPTSAGFRLLRARDRQKDQTYFLYGIKQGELKETSFPLADLTKDEVREIAREAGLPTASKPESQDICFVSGSVHDFVTRIGGSTRKGKIVDVSGTVVGDHDGLSRFTVGQRRGIGIGGNEEPLYVIELDGERNTVVVGKKEELSKEGFSAVDINWVSSDITEKLEKNHGFLQFRAVAQLRHRHAGSLVDVEVKGENKVHAKFVEASSVVSRGQAVVFYCLNNEEVLGGGTLV